MTDKKSEYLNLPFLTLVALVFVGGPLFLYGIGGRIEREKAERVEATRVKNDASEQRRQEHLERVAAIRSTCTDCICFEGTPGYIGLKAKGKELSKYIAREYKIVHPMGDSFKYTHRGNRYCTACQEIIEAIYVKKHGKYPNPLAP